MIEGYVTVTAMAEKWGLTPRTVQILCRDGKISGVTRFGSLWAIPADAEKPTDNRLKTGKYVNWRKNLKKNKTEER